MPGLSRAGTADTMRGFGRAGTDCFVLFQAINKIMVRNSQLEWQSVFLFWVKPQAALYPKESYFPSHIIEITFLFIFGNLFFKWH